MNAEEGVCLDNCAEEYFRLLYRNKSPLNGDVLTCGRHNGRSAWSDSVREGVADELEGRLGIPKEVVLARLGGEEYRRFAARVLGIPVDKVPRPIGEIQRSMWRKRGLVLPRFESRLRLPGIDGGLEEVDVGEYLPLGLCDDARRLDGVASLGNVRHLHLGYGDQTREEHQWWVWNATRLLADRVGLKGDDLRKVLAYAKTHDFGHITGGHASDEFLKSMCGLDHEIYGERRLRASAGAFEGIASVEDVLNLLREKDPLHVFVAGPLGGDRIGYMKGDVRCCGLVEEFNPFSIIETLRFDRDKMRIVSMDAERAAAFLDTRSGLYERLYYHPNTQKADAAWKRVLWLAGVRSYEDLVLVDGEERPFWSLTDNQSRDWLANHERADVREIVGYLSHKFHFAPYATVALLKLPGYERSEGCERVADAQGMSYSEEWPVSQSASQDELVKYHKGLKSMPKKGALERAVIECMRSYFEDRHIDYDSKLLCHTTVASVPKMDKLAAEEVPIESKGRVVSLFEEWPIYRFAFEERVRRMGALRLCVHPDLYSSAKGFFERYPLKEFADKML